AAELPVFQPIASPAAAPETDQPAFRPFDPPVPPPPEEDPADRPHYAPIPPGGVPPRQTQSPPEPLAAPRPRRSLNERWKALRLWQQWTVVVILVALIAVTIFLLPI